MGISWREVLGLLIGLALCYATISYALSHASSSGGEGPPRPSSSTIGQTQQRTDPAAPLVAGGGGQTEMVSIRVTSETKGEAFGINYGDRGASSTEEGAAPKEYEVRVGTDPKEGDYVSATAWKKEDDGKELRVEVVEGGKVVKEGSTKEGYGAVSVRWSPGEKSPPSGGGGTTGASTTATPLPDAEKNK